MNLIERVAAAQRTTDDWLGQEFDWSAKSDCGYLACTHLETCGIKTPIDVVRNYTTETGARRALKLLGCDSMEDLIDHLGLERIAPAAALAGDIVGLPGGEEGNEWTALGVHLGDNRCLAFVQATGDVARVHAGDASVCTLAWRVV